MSPTFPSHARALVETAEGLSPAPPRSRKRGELRGPRFGEGFSTARLTQRCFVRRRTRVVLPRFWLLRFCDACACGRRSIHRSGPDNQPNRRHRDRGRNFSPGLESGEMPDCFLRVHRTDVGLSRISHALAFKRPPMPRPSDNKRPPRADGASGAGSNHPVADLGLKA